MTGIEASSNLTTKVDAYMQALVKLDQFSGSILIAREGKVLVSKGYSLANREHGVPNTPKTKFRLGSVTKQFTAMAILILQNQGVVHVQDPVSKLLPNCPDAWERVTIHHLLNHTSGIPEYTTREFFETTGRSKLSVQGVVDLFRNRPMDFYPGEEYRYSNSGYILLGQIVEVMSGMSYESFASKHIFEPLVMENTGYDWSSRVLEHRAMGYGHRNNRYVNAEFLDMSLPHAAGALYSTVEDLLLWDSALYTDRLVPKDSLETMFMFTPFLANYGYGVAIRREFNRQVIGHSGGIPGFVTHLDRYPEDKICIVVLSNLESSTPSKVSRTVAAIVFGEEYKIPDVRVPLQLEPEVYRLYEGDYRLTAGVVISIRAGDRRLIATAGGGGEGEFFPDSDTVFFQKANDDKITFFKDETGGVTYLSLRQQGIEERAFKIND